MAALLTNNAFSTLAGSLTNVATSFSVAAGEGARFPNPGGGQYFYCTLSDLAGTTIEIVKVTARATDAFTVVRGQDGTTGVAFSAGDLVELRPIAELFREKLDALRGNWKVFYSDSSGLFTELALGAAGTVLQSNGASSAPTFVTPAAGMTPGAPDLKTSGTTYTTPAGCTKLLVEVVGGGGAGGAGSNTIGSGGGGGGGGYAKKLYTVTPSTGYTYAAGGAGAPSTFTDGVTLITGGAGTAGAAGSSGAGGAGGAGTNGDVNISGESGDQQEIPPASGGGGDGGHSGLGMGAGGRGGGNNTVGFAGVLYGGGGGGGGENTSRAGGAGAAGCVIFTPFTS